MVTTEKGSRSTVGTSVDKAERQIGKKRDAMRVGGFVVTVGLAAILASCATQTRGEVMQTRGEVLDCPGVMEALTACAQKQKTAKKARDRYDEMLAHPEAHTCRAFVNQLNTMNKAIDNCRLYCGLPSMCPSKANSGSLPEKCRGGR